MQSISKTNGFLVFFGWLFLLSTQSSYGLFPRQFCATPKIIFWRLVKLFLSFVEKKNSESVTKTKTFFATFLSTILYQMSEKSHCTTTIKDLEIISHFFAAMLKVWKNMPKFEHCYIKFLNPPNYILMIFYF